jgi:hypothetical protein
MKLMDKESKLTDFIKFDSALAREQNIEMGRPSTLGDVEVIEIQGGVKLTQFGPQKRLQKNKSLSNQPEVWSETSQR